ncbi:hypothetical protein [Sphingomonas sp.]|uniref:hypothetical protein n=1 Tax=Sphingomonas sp. TaxID=28214 RepID=UPI002DD66FC1|nr:hypothetical protein [Sphingomonas sp.]
MTNDAADPTGYAARYRALTKDTRQWLSYHFAEGRVTPFGHRLAKALAACDARLPGAGERFVRELAETRYIPTKDDPDAWKQGYEQLVQKLAEVLVTRVVVDADWPAGTTFAIEPTNPATGGRPDLVVDAPSRQWLFEIKCPSFVKHQEQRASRGQQLPVRGPLGADAAIRADATLPRDNTLKDFLVSAENKFRDFSTEPRTGILVVLWDGYVFEATSALSHEEAGLLTAKSWHLDAGNRVPFDAVDGVIILNHLEILKLAPQEQRTRRDDPFTIGGYDQPPNVWCPNLGGGELDPFVAGIFDATPLGNMVAGDYTPKDYVMWIDLDRER